MARTRLAGGMLAAAVLAAGCTGQATPATSGSAGGQPQDEVDGTPLAPPPSGPQARSSAVDAARAAVAAYVRKGIDPGQWAAGLSPLLTPQASADYLGTDPARPATDPNNVPGQAVTGAAELVPNPSSQYLVEAQVPTDAGNYLVLLQAASDSQLPHPWLVVTIVPPEPGS